MCLLCVLASEIKDIETFDRIASPALHPNPVDDGTTYNFETFDQKWGDSQVFGTSGGIVSYGFATKNTESQFSDFDSFINDPGFQDEITTSLSAWENVADIRFVLASDSDNADIKFGWREIDGSGDVLAQTTVPSSGALENVTIAMDVDEDWFVSGDAPFGQFDFSSTVTHEIGHAIGIDHSQSRQALMNAAYSSSIFEIQQDDIDASIAIYGENDVVRIDVHRFYNPVVGGHFFTADAPEKDNVIANKIFNNEGVGFTAISRVDEDIAGSVPIYRFFNTELGSHFFTASEIEKMHVLTLEGFIFEGVGFRGFNRDSSSTVPIHRFFNVDSGGHLFTASEIEKISVMDLTNLRYEGEAFYAFS